MNRQKVNGTNQLKTRPLELPAGGGATIQGKLKMKASPTMLLKTHIEKMSGFGYPTMLMKNKPLISTIPRYL